VKTRFHIAISVGQRPKSALEVGPQRFEGKVGFSKRLLAGVILAAVAIVALVVALVIGSLIALMVWGALAIAIVSLILRISFRQKGQRDYAKLPTGKCGQ
jgi:hypothetical protein